MMLFASVSFAEHDTVGSYFKLMFDDYGYNDSDGNRMLSLAGIEKFYRAIGYKKTKAHTAAHRTKALLYYMEFAGDNDTNSVGKKLKDLTDWLAGTKIDMMLSIWNHNVSLKNVKDVAWPNAKRFQQAFNEFNTLKWLTPHSISWPEWKIAEGFSKIFLHDEHSLGSLIYMNFAWSLNRRIKTTFLKSSGNLKGNVLKYKWQFGLGVDTLSENVFMAFMENGVERVINQIRTQSDED